VGTGTANQFAGQKFLFSNEVNQLGNTSELGLYVQGGSPSNTDFSPMYLILGFVNQNASFTLPTITKETVYNNAGTPNGSGIINAGAANVNGTATISALTSINSVPGPGSTSLPLVWTGTPNSAYDALGLGGADASENFTNWVAAEAHLSPAIVATQFLLAAYDISSFTHTSSFTGNGLIDLTFSGILPAGTMAIGFGCQAADCSANPNPFSNAFTQSGITQGPPTTTGGGTASTGGGTASTGGGTASTGGNIPEPGSVFLLGTVMMLISSRIWKRKGIHRG
jgi:hypothetical protein